MKWAFVDNHGGRETGFHDAGVETFKGDFDRYLARELIQNSLDAVSNPKKPVEVVFSLTKLSREDIPDIDSLKAAFDSSKKYWHHDAKASEFFKKASQLAQKSTIEVLRFSDFNTTGVLGSDTAREKNWYNLIRSAGSSSKGGGEGGSFGIGKNAPFAASKLRTVLYSTLNTDKEHIFQGVAMLVSHTGRKGKTVQPVAYLGGDGGASIRTKAKIPEVFLRKSVGTDISILGFDARTHWQEDLVYSVLDNFWPAIEFGDLVVRVGDQSIDKLLLPELLIKFSMYEGFTAHLYYDAYKNPSHPTLNHKLPSLKTVSLYLRAGEKDLPKRIVMVRKTGMKIFEKPFRSIVPFCGVFVCRNEEGNSKLREMEPPRHDTWDPDYPDKGANRKIESEYVAFVRSCISELSPIEDVSVMSIPGLSRYLPDDDETEEEKFDASDESTKNEAFDRNLLPEKIVGQTVERKKQKLQSDETDPSQGENPTNKDEGEISITWEGKNQGGSKDGTKSGKGGKNQSESGVGTGQHGGSHAKPALAIRYRTFVVNSNSGIYRATVKPETIVQGQTELVFWVVGDDQKIEAEIRSARFVSGGDIPVNRNCVVGPLSMPLDGVQVEVVLATPRRVAMEVTAHEVI